jgi:hypothetical protein
MAATGLVVYEWSCTGARLVLRTFSGQLVRVLAPAPLSSTPANAFVAAGEWMAFIQFAVAPGQQQQLRIVDVRTGQTVLHLSRGGPPATQGLDAVALDRSGRFVVTTGVSQFRRCGRKEFFSGLSVGRVGHRGLRALTRSAEGLASGGMAIAANRVAYGQPTGSCLTGSRVVTKAPGSAPTPLPGLTFAAPVAFDGRVVATAHGNTVQLAAMHT